MTTGAGAASEEGGLVGDGRAARARAAASAGRASRSDGGREDEGGGVVAGETWRVTVTTD
jgi:hypothetical protein